MLEYCNEVDKSELIFKYFCSTDVVMSWKAALNWNCLDFRTAASALSHCGVVWMAEQGAQLCKNSPSPKIHQIKLCWPLSPVWYNCMSTAWISSHFCKCKSQVNPLKREQNSGKQGESEASSSLCRYSVKSHQQWKNNPSEKSFFTTVTPYNSGFPAVFLSSPSDHPVTFCLSNSSWVCWAWFSPDNTSV